MNYNPKMWTFKEVIAILSKYETECVLFDVEYNNFNITLIVRGREVGGKQFTHTWVRTATGYKQRSSFRDEYLILQRLKGEEL